MPLKSLQLLVPPEVSFPISDPLADANAGKLVGVAGFEPASLPTITAKRSMPCRYRPSKRAGGRGGKT
jgi:hypothetical protein